MKEIHLTEKISSLVRKVGEELKIRHLSLVIAESCTGGGLTYFISKEPCCSAVLERSYVVYSIHAKESILGVSAEALQTFGAVSKEVSQQMARGALNNSTAQIAISTTGIVGEDLESSHQKGILWVSCAGIHKKLLTKNLYIPGSRDEFIYHSIAASLKLLHQFVRKF